MKVFVSILVLFIVAGCSIGKKRDPDKLLQSLLQGYSKRIPPSDIAGRPIVVKVGLYINNFELDEDKENLLLNLYVRQTWVDVRLTFPDEELTAGIDAAKAIWMPGIFFRNAVQKHRIDDNEVLVKLYGDGKVWYAERLVLTTKCNLYFHKFPFDTQRCDITIESFKYKMDTYILRFLDDREPVTFDDQARSSGMFTVDNTRLIDCTQNYSTGAYPCLGVIIDFKREASSAHMVHKFVPSVFILFFIYASTWMGHQVLLPRSLVLIAGTVLLTANMITSGLHLKHLTTGYVTAGDSWFPVLVILLMAAILEFCLVARLCSHTDKTPKGSVSKYSKLGNLIEWIFRIVFLVVIILFLIIYFSIYLA